MEFMVAVINNFGGFYSTELYFHELRRAGAVMHAPCVNRSDELTNIRGVDVFMGLIHIKELERASLERILEARSRSGNFMHLQDFLQRTGIGMEQANILIRIGAFRFTGKIKKSCCGKPISCIKRSDRWPAPLMNYLHRIHWNSGCPNWNKHLWKMPWTRLRSLASPL